MKKNPKTLLLLAGLLLMGSAVLTLESVLNPETLSLTTYYSAPVGAYKTLAVRAVLESAKSAYLASLAEGFVLIGKTSRAAASNILEAAGTSRMQDVAASGSLQARSLTLDSSTLAGPYPLKAGSGVSLSPDGNWWEHEVTINAEAGAGGGAPPPSMTTNAPNPIYKLPPGCCTGSDGKTNYGCGTYTCQTSCVTANQPGWYGCSGGITIKNPPLRCDGSINTDCQVLSQPPWYVYPTNSTCQTQKVSETGCP